MIFLYNEYFNLFSRIKRFLGKGARGPEAVFESLIKGLSELGEGFRVNQLFLKPLETVCVLSDAKVLKQAVKQKQEGKIKKLIAGPNIVIFPDESNAVLRSKEIDKIIVPSQWVKDYYLSVAPELSTKISVWAAGVDVPLLTTEKKELDFILIIKLKRGMTLPDHIIGYLKQHNYKVRILYYGEFKQDDYFNSLNRSKYLIYLSESESQGLVMFEAWARNVPTLVWNRGYMQHGSYRWAGNTAAPYLTENTGMTFRDFNEFLIVLPKFLSKNFSAMEWIKNNAANKIAAQKYLDIINNV